MTVYYQPLAFFLLGFIKFLRPWITATNQIVSYTAIFGSSREERKYSCLGDHQFQICISAFFELVFKENNLLPFH